VTVVLFFPFLRLAEPLLVLLKSTSSSKLPRQQLTIFKSTSVREGYLCTYSDVVFSFVGLVGLLVM
jgi:hypothetical protein